MKVFILFLIGFSLKSDESKSPHVSRNSLSIRAVVRMVFNFSSGLQLPKSLFQVLWGLF